MKPHEWANCELLQPLLSALLPEADLEAHGVVLLGGHGAADMPVGTGRPLRRSADRGDSVDLLRPKDGDVNNWATGWTDWNFCLDRSGGPNWAKNECDSPILIDTEHSEAAAPVSVDTFYKQPMYYYFGHVTAFAPPNSTRLGVTTTATTDGTRVKAKADQVAAAFLAPDGARVAVVVMNRDDEGRDVAVHVGSHGVINVKMDAHSIRTFVLDSMSSSTQ